MFLLFLKVKLSLNQSGTPLPMLDFICSMGVSLLHPQFLGAFIMKHVVHGLVLEFHYENGHYSPA